MDVQTPLAQLIHSLGRSQRAIGRQCQISAAAMHRLVQQATWPKYGAAGLRAQLRGALIASGATPAQAEAALPPLPCKKLASAVDATEAVPPEEPVTETPEESSMLIPEPTLSLQAVEQFRLQLRNPFQGEVTCDAEMFTNAQIAYIHQSAWQAVIGGRVVAVVGESGAGKTTMLDDMRDRILRERHPVVCITPSVAAMEESDTKGRALKTSDLYTAIAYALDKRARVPRDAQKRSQAVREMLEQSTQAERRHLLVIEEAHAMPTVTLNQIKRLNEEMRMGRRYMLGILLLGHPELAAKLTRHDVRESMQRTSIVRLEPLGADLAAYLQCRAQAAGRSLDEFITPEGVDELKARLTVQRGPRTAPLSMLYPLNVNNWMTLCVNTAAGLGAPRIDRDVVRVANPDNLIV